MLCVPESNQLQVHQLHAQQNDDQPQVYTYWFPADWVIFQSGFCIGQVYNASEPRTSEGESHRMIPQLGEL